MKVVPFNRKAAIQPTPAGAFVFGAVHYYYFKKPSFLRIFLLEWLLQWEWKDMNEDLARKYYGRHLI